MSSRSSLLIALSAVAALILGVVSVGLVLFRPQPSLAASSDAPRRELTVVGSGTARATPDTVIVQLGVQTQAPTAQAALHDNTAKMQALLARLKQLGIPNAAMQTSNLSLWSNQEGPNPDAITYRAGNSVVVTLSNVDKVSTTLEQVLAAGANTINGVSFAVAYPEQFQQAARAQAIAHAQAQAQAMARASGATLGAMVRISEDLETPPPGAYTAPAAGGAPVEGPPIKPGEQTISARVQISFELR